MTTDLLQPVAPENSDKANGVQPVVEQPTPAQADKDEELTPELREELRRNLNASKEEALRLKADRDRLAAEKAELEAKYANAGQSQDSGSPISESDVVLFKQIAQKAGLAFKEDTESIRNEKLAEKNQETLNGFLTSHPEYNKPSDVQSDKLWNELQAELGYYKPAKTPQELHKLLEKAHKAIAKNYDEQTAVVRGEALGFAKANIAPSVGSSSRGGTPSTQKGKSPEKQAISEGFASVRPQYYK